MDKFEKTFELEPNLTVTTTRLLPNRNIFNQYKFIPIENSAFWSVDRQCSLNDEEYKFFLPKLYVALTHLTGPGDFSYDTYKGSYSFTFKLNVKKNKATSQYVYHVYHYRSYVEFSLYQIVPPTDKRDSHVLRKPKDALFSDEDICYFSAYFCSYALGYLEGSGYIPEPFAKYSDSNLLLFGYSENQYFIKQYESQTQYLKKRDLLLKKKMHKFDIAVP